MFSPELRDSVSPADLKPLTHICRSLPTFSLSVSPETTDTVKFPGTILQLEPSGQREHLDRAPRYLACVPEAGMVGVIESFYMCHVPTAELCRGAA